MMEKYDTIKELKAKDIMGTSPRVINEDELAVNALEIMRENNITQLLVVRDEKYSGIVHLHDLLREGII
jgi:arabinose-5-phosphate isomerase